MRICAFLVTLTAALVAAQTSTVDLFLPSAYDSNVAFAASIIGACADQTTYDIQCTRGIFASTITCDSNGPRFTVTEGPSTYAATTRTSFTSAIMTLTENCVLSGTTDAKCANTVAIFSNFKTVTSTVMTAISGPTLANYYMYKVEVTAGVEKLTDGNACTSGGDRRVGGMILGSLVGTFVFTVVFVL